MELNSGRRLDDFGIGELNGTVWNAAPIFCKPLVLVPQWGAASALHSHRFSIGGRKRLQQLLGDVPGDVACADAELGDLLYVHEALGRASFKDTPPEAYIRPMIIPDCD